MWQRQRGGHHPATYGTETQRLRMQQIESLINKNPGTRELNAQRTVFAVPFRHPQTGQVLYLNVTLPHHFPQERPRVNLTTPMSHPWLDASCNVVSPRLQQWNPHTDVGNVVREVVDEFTNRPPAPAGTPQSQYGQQQQPYGQQQQPYGQYGNQQAPPRYEPPQPQQQEQQQFSASSTMLPRKPTDFPELNSLNLKQLQNLGQDRETFEAFFSTLDCVGEMAKVREDLESRCKEVAVSNTSCEAEVKTIREEVGKLRKTFEEKQAVLDAKVSVQRDILKRFSVPSILALLSKKASEAEDESENIANDFVRGRMDADDFISKFVEVRKLYHERNAKKERLSNLPLYPQ